MPLAGRRSLLVSSAVALVFLVACGGTGTDEPAAAGIAAARDGSNRASTTVSSSPDVTAITPLTESTADPTADPTVEPGPAASSAACRPAPVPESAGLDPFYTRGCELDGFWVVAADEVDPAAIVAAAEMAGAFFDYDPELASTLQSTDLRLGIIGRNQRTTEMPEYRNLQEVFPGTDWDNDIGGVAATDDRPLLAVREENLLCLPEDRYLGEDILLHELAHLFHEHGYALLDPTFEERLFETFADALDNDTWIDTYAAENAFEYWAESVQTYFGRNRTSAVADGIHGPIGTRAELATADPTLFALIEEKLGSVELPAGCSPDRS